VKRDHSRNGELRLNRFTRDADRDRFLSPALPEVRRYLAGVVGEILRRYRVDGLHLDYIRYPSEDAGFEIFARRAFSALYSFDPIEIYQAGPIDGFAGDAHDRSSLERQWRQWRRRQVTELLREIRRVQESIAPDITLSVAVIPGIEKARRSYGQDWPAWANEGLIDLVVTMSYSRSKGIVLSQAREAREAILKGRLFIGIAVYNQSLKNMLECAREVRTIDVDGISLFSYNAILETPENFARIRRSLFRVPPRPAGPAEPE